MTTVTYTAEASLTAGHSQGSSYELRIPCSDIDPGRSVNKTQNATLSQRSETLLWSRKKTYQITTANLRRGQRDQMLEFLDSVEDGQQFTFDEFGLPGQPSTPLTVILTGRYTQSRSVKQGAGGADDYFRFTFSVREA